MYKTVTKNKLNNKNKRQKSRILFYSLMMILPVVHFLVFYVYINFNSIFMSFQTEFKNIPGQGWTATGYGFDNFVTAWNYLVDPINLAKVGHTFIFFAVNLFIDIPLSLFSSYYLYKKKFASPFYKVMLFLPQILSAMVLATLYKYLCNNTYTTLTGEQYGLLANPDTMPWMLLLFNLIMSFGVNVLIYTSAMSGINESYIESAELDGCGSFRMFYKIIIPMIFPTVSTMLVMAFACIFVEQWQAYTLFGNAAEGFAQNIGYDIFNLSLNNSIIGEGRALNYRELSAMGLILTAFILPVTLLFRKALDKLGPSSR